MIRRHTNPDLPVKQKSPLVATWIWTSFALGFTFSPALAQDPQTSQIYNAPLWLNPVFTGNTAYHCKGGWYTRTRVMGSYRSQWGGLMQNQRLAADYTPPSGLTGVGVLLAHDVAGTPSIQHIQGGLSGPYHLQIVNGWRLSSGVAVTYHQRSLGTSGALLPDQYTSEFYNNVISPTGDPALAAYTPATYIDASVGVIAFKKNRAVGASFWHANDPDFSLTGGTEALSPKLNLHASYRHSLSGERRAFLYHQKPDTSVSPFVHIKNQFGLTQAEFGANTLLQSLALGAWYRGLPLNPNPAGVGVHNESLVPMAGIAPFMRAGYLKAGVSYDVPLRASPYAF